MADGEDEIAQAMFAGNVPLVVRMIGATARQRVSMYRRRSPGRCRFHRRSKHLDHDPCSTGAYCSRIVERHSQLASAARTGYGYSALPSAIEFTDRIGLSASPWRSGLLYGTCPRKNFARSLAPAISKPKSLPATIIRMPIAIYLASKSSAYTPPMPGHFPCLRQAAMTLS